MAVPRDLKAPAYGYREHRVETKQHIDGKRVGLHHSRWHWGLAQGHSGEQTAYQIEAVWCMSKCVHGGHWLEVWDT